MKKGIRFIVRALLSCIGLGLVVSLLDNNKGWVEGHTPPYGPYEKYFRRLLDYGLALFALIIL